jgi:hypothetical protein
MHPPFPYQVPRSQAARGMVISDMPALLLTSPRTFLSAYTYYHSKLLNH